MPIPLAVPIVGAGLGLAGSLLGSGGGLPQDFIDELSNKANSFRTDAFLPNEAAYNADLEAKIAEIMSQVTGGVENFNANAASRGVYTSGEGLTHLYSDVYAPIARAGTSAVAAGKLGYAQAYQQGSIAAENIKQNYYSLLTNAMLNKSPSFGDKLGGTLQDLGGLGVQAYLYDKLGLFG